MYEIKLTKEFKTLFIITFLYDYAIKKVHKQKKKIISQYPLYSLMSNNIF